MANCSASNSNPAGSTSANNPRSNPVHGYQSLIKDQPAVQSAEMTKYLKQNFMAPKGDGKYKPEHIVHKTSTIRVPSPDQNTWKNHFLRRKSHLEKGFFTPSYKSYSSVGSVELNPQQLVLDVFQGCLSKKRTPLPSILTGRLPVRSSPCQDTQHSQIKSPSNVHHSSTGGLDFSDEDIQSAGFSFIKHNLKDSEKMLIANKGGLPFDQCLRDIERSKEMSQDDDTQSAVTFLPPVQGDNNIPMVPTMEIYAMPISSAPDPTRPCSETRAAEKDREMEQERMFFNRSRRLMVEKLRTIQMVLNALHNIKSRDLRSRVPLSLETVKVLFKDVADKPFQRPVKDVHHSSNDTVNSPDKVPVSGLTSKTAIPTRKASTMGRTEGLVSTTPTFQWRKHRQNIMHPKKELRVETWEDLVTMSSPSHGHRHSVLPSMVPNPVGRWVGQHRHGDSQKLPLWQTVGVANEDKVTRPAPSTKSKNGTSRGHPDPEATLKSLIQNFTRVKKKLAREVHSDLERLLRDRSRTFRQKFHCLNKSPLFERTMQHLKEVSASQPVPVITEDTTTEIKSSKWYTDLKSGAENIVGKGDKEVNLLLQQLARFSLEDAKSIPNAKEKLCLLVMSMPASQLLTIPAQQALKYVLEEILWASSECLSQWLNHRKIPMILQETSASVMADQNL